MVLFAIQALLDSRDELGDVELQRLVRKLEEGRPQDTYDPLPYKCVGYAKGTLGSTCLHWMRADRRALPVGYSVWGAVLRGHAAVVVDRG